LGLGSFYIQKWPFKVAFEGYSAIDWCKKYFGKDITEIFWEPLLKAKFSVDFDKINMLWLRSRLRDRASSRGLPWKDESLGYIDGSINTLIVKLMETLEKGNVKIVTNADITSYQFKVNKHRLTYKVGNKFIREDYDVLISTIAPKLFIKLFDPPKKYINQLQKIKFLGALCLTLTLEKQFMPYYWLTINDPNKPFLAVIEHTNLIDKALYDNKNILYLGKYLSPKDELFNLTDEEMLNIAVKFLKELNPDFEKSWIKNVSIIKTDTAQHIVDSNITLPLPYVGKNGLYYAHFSQIQDHDRGVNYAIAQSLNLSKLIIGNERINNNS
jgi:protoporphyrinogen oxidase